MNFNKEEWKLRRLKSLISELNIAIDRCEDIDQIPDKANPGLFIEKNLSSIGDSLVEAIDCGVEEFQQGLMTGLRDLDWMLGGFNKSELVIIAGRPSMGKSTLAMQIAEHISNQETVIIFSLEMAKRQVAHRFLKFHESLIDKAQAISHLYGLKMYIDDKSAISIAHIRSQCRKIKREHGLSMIVVDCIQLMAGAEDKEKISHGLKEIAMEFDISVVAISRLNRNVDVRISKRPVMSDLRESGEIEQDADLILFIYRDEVYHTDSKNKGLAEIICCKNRNRSIVSIITKFNGEITRFSDFNGKRILRSVKKKERGYTGLNNESAS